MKVINLFNREKISPRNKQLLEEYNKGRILQVDNDIDNKELMRKLKNE